MEEKKKKTLNQNKFALEVELVLQPIKRNCIQLFMCFAQIRVWPKIMIRFYFLFNFLLRCKTIAIALDGCIFLSKKLSINQFISGSILYFIFYILMYHCTLLIPIHRLCMYLLSALKRF